MELLFCLERIKLLKNNLYTMYIEKQKREEKDMFSKPMDKVAVLDLFVELTLVEADEVDKIVREYSDMIHQLFPRPTEHSSLILIKDLVSIDDVFVLLRGVGGQGKTYLVNYIAYQWAEERIKKHKGIGKLKNIFSKQDFSFIFLISAREVNTLLNERISNITDLLQELGYDITVAEDEIEWNKVLLIIDGIDELSFLENLIQTNKSLTGLEKVMYDIMRRKKKHTVLISGRPEACWNVQTRFSEFFKIKCVETTGFSQESVLKYIDNFFTENKDAASRLKQAIHDIGSIASLVQVPVLLWTLCCIYSDTSNVVTPRTVTELYTLSFLMFIKKHLRKDDRHFDVMNLSEETLALVKALADMGEEKLAMGMIMFDSVSQDIESLLEKSGFLIRRQIGYKKYYMYNHLSFHEFLAALSAKIKGTTYTAMEKNKHFKGVLNILSGFDGASIQNTQSSIFLQNFIKHFIPHYPELNTENHVISQICERLASTRRGFNGSILFSRDPKDRQSMQFLMAAHEHQNVPEKIVQKLKSVSFRLANFTKHQFAQTHYLLCLCIKYKIKIEELNFKFVGDESCPQIMTLIELIPHAYFAKFAYDKISEQATNTIVKSLKNQVAKGEDIILKKLQFIDCKFHDSKVIELLSEAIPLVEEFDLQPSHDQFTDEAATSIAEKIIEHGKGGPLRKLSVSNHRHKTIKDLLEPHQDELQLDIYGR